MAKYLDIVWLSSAIHNFCKGSPITEDNIHHLISLAPTLEERKVGKRIVKNAKKQGYDIAGIKTWYIQIVCNKCGFTKTAIEGHTGQYNYCPNCGAEMVGVENG